MKKILWPCVASDTKRDRLTEITDFGTYLSSLYDKITSIYQIALRRFWLFPRGRFFVGCITAKLNDFIPYACWIPEDIPIKTGKQIDAYKHLLMGRKINSSQRNAFMVNDVIEKPAIHSIIALCWYSSN